MQYKKPYIFGSINQDLAPDKRDSSTHWNIQNMETYFTERGLSLNAAKGVLLLSETYKLANMWVIGEGTIENNLFLFVTNNLGNPSTNSYDVIFKIGTTELDQRIDIVKNGNFQFSGKYPITAEGIVENEESEKLYFVDGYNQARFIDVKNPTGIIDFAVKNENPGIISATLYGIPALDNAVVRYGFTQYNIGGSESKLSPLSSPINISKEEGSARIYITNMSQDFTNYRVYRLKWLSEDGAPEYALIADGSTPSTGLVDLLDSGDLFISTLSVDEFYDIGSDLLIPKTLSIKKQIMFFGNVKLKDFRIEDDTRAYFHNSVPMDMGEPEAIPAEIEHSYIPFVNGSRLQTVLDAELNGTILSADLYVPPLGMEEPPIDDQIPYVDAITFQIDNPSFTVKLLEEDGGGIVGFNMTIYEYDYSNNLVELESRILIKGIAEFVNISPNNDRYFVKIKPTPSYFPPDTPPLVYASVEYSTSGVYTTTFDVPHDSVPDMYGYTYSGVTGFLANTRASFASIYGDLIYSAYFTPTSVVNNGTYSTFTFTFPSGLLINSNIMMEGLQMFVRLEAYLEGTRQQITGSSLSLASTDNSITLFSNFNLVPINHDSINPDPEEYKYQSDGATLGAEGPMVKFRFKLIENSEETSKNRMFKSGENYRLGIVFYNEYGANSFAKWVTDFVVPYAEGSNNEGYRNYYLPQATLKYLPEGAVSYKFVYVPREVLNKTVLMEGIVQPIMAHQVEQEITGVYPFPNMKEVKATPNPTYFDIRRGYYGNYDFPLNTMYRQLLHNKNINMLYTPETLIKKNSVPATGVRIVGIQKVDPDRDSTRIEFYNPGKPETEKNLVMNSMEFRPYELFGINSNNIPRCLFNGYGEDDSIKPYIAYMYSRYGKEYYNSPKKDVPIEYCKYLGEDATLVVESFVLKNVLNEINYSGTVGQNPTHYGAEFCSAFVFNTNDTEWCNNFDDFKIGLTEFNSSSVNRAFPIVNITRESINQYGGRTYEAKSLNTYIDCSAGSNTINTYISLFGDTYSGLYRIAKTTGARSFGAQYERYTSVFDYITVGLESQVCMQYSNKLLKDTNCNFTSKIIADNLKAIEVKNLYSYDAVFSKVPDSVITPAQPYNYRSLQYYPQRVYPTNVKSVGEVVDNWTKVNMKGYIDLESPYGPITKLVRVKDNILSFQSRAIAALSILPDKQVSTPSGAVQLAKGGVLDNYIYLSIESGCENPQAIAVYEDDVYYIDTVNKTLNTIQNKEISVLNGFNDVTKKYIKEGIKQTLLNNPDGGFVVINNALKQVLFKFSKDFEMLVYNFVTKQFVGTRTYKSYFFFSHNNNVYSIYQHKLGIHDKGEIGNYHGPKFPAFIDMYIEPVPFVDKVFDAVSVLKQGDIFDYIRIDSPTRTSGLMPANFKSKFDIHTVHLPRILHPDTGLPTRERFRERNIHILLWYSKNNPMYVDEIMVKFSIKKP